MAQVAGAALLAGAVTVLTSAWIPWGPSPAAASIPAASVITCLHLGALGALASRVGSPGPSVLVLLLLAWLLPSLIPVPGLVILLDPSTHLNQWMGGVTYGTADSIGALSTGIAAANSTGPGTPISIGTSIMMLDIVVDMMPVLAIALAAGLLPDPSRS